MANSIVIIPGNPVAMVTQEKSPQLKAAFWKCPVATDEGDEGLSQFTGEDFSHQPLQLHLEV